MLLGSTVIEVAFGMLFVYLLLSLLCSAVGEYIEAKYNNRAKYLRKGIELLLNDTSGKGADLAQLLYDHGLVRPLYRDKNKLPSYIPSRTFALALWNMATASEAGGGVSNDLNKIRQAVTQLPNQELRTAMLTLIDEAHGDLDRARRNIEDWYEGMMDRVSGWYKRRTGVLMLLLGFVIAFAINADSINLAKALARDSALRSAVVRAAERRLAAPEAQAESQAQQNVTPEQAADDAATRNLQQVSGELNALGLPLGWVCAPDTSFGWICPPSADPTDSRRVPDTIFGFILKLFGILLTGFAVSQGAPFWFDVLNKFMVIRSTVKPAEKSKEQPSKDRPAPTTEIEKEEEKEDPGKG
jgi:hypothetical protein